MTALLTVPEVAERLRIGSTLCRELIARGEIRSLRVGGRAIRVREQAIDDYIRRLEGGDDESATREWSPRIAHIGGHRLGSRRKAV